MDIYIASSWRNQHAVEMLTYLLEDRGHTVHSFVRKAAADEGRVNFGSPTLEEWVWSEDGAKKFEYDTGHARTSDLVVYIGPSGPDAWAEIGVAWASGVPVCGLWAKGEPVGLMRRMVEVWFDDHQALLRFLVTALKEAE